MMKRFILLILVTFVEGQEDSAGCWLGTMTALEKVCLLSGMTTIKWKSI